MCWLRPSVFGSSTSRRQESRSNTLQHPLLNLSDNSAPKNLCTLFVHESLNKFRRIYLDSRCRAGVSRCAVRRTKKSLNETYILKTESFLHFRLQAYLGVRSCLNDLSRRVNNGEILKLSAQNDAERIFSMPSHRRDGFTYVSFDVTEA